jgi:hypothetical protein
VGGVDNSGARRMAIAQFLQSTRTDPLDLAVQLKGLQDVPGQKVTTTTRQKAEGVGRQGSPSKKGMSPLLEMFWQGEGGINVKNNRKVQQGFVSGHTDHVHVAAGPKTVVRLGKLAQQMGLRVGENPAFEGGQRTTSGHAPNSYHYRDQAIDVSGDPDKMRHFAAVVAHKYGLKVK